MTGKCRRNLPEPQVRAMTSPPPSLRGSPQTLLDELLRASTAGLLMMAANLREGSLSMKSTQMFSSVNTEATHRYATDLSGATCPLLPVTLYGDSILRGWAKGTASLCFFPNGLWSLAVPFARKLPACGSPGLWWTPACRPRTGLEAGFIYSGFMLIGRS